MSRLTLGPNVIFDVVFSSILTKLVKLYINFSFFGEKSEDKDINRLELPSTDKNDKGI